MPGSISRGSAHRGASPSERGVAGPSWLRTPTHPPASHRGCADSVVAAPLPRRAMSPGSPGNEGQGKGALRSPRCGLRPARASKSTPGRPHLHQALGEEATVAPQLSAQPAPCGPLAHLSDHIPQCQTQFALLLCAVSCQDQHLCGRKRGSEGPSQGRQAVARVPSSV